MPIPALANSIDRTVTKTIFLLNINDFAPEITRLTYPLIKYYAERIGAHIHVIQERQFPEWPVTYEKLQIHKLAREIGSDWNLYVDSDTLIHPDCPDFTIYLPKGTVSFHMQDVSHVRFGTNEYSLRDGRYIAPGNWFMIASDLCLDLWRPLECSPRQAVAQIHPTANEMLHGITPEHLVDDYALSQNIARFGLTFRSLVSIYKEYGFQEYLYHEYTLNEKEKAEKLAHIIAEWKVEEYLERYR